MLVVDPPAAWTANPSTAVTTAEAGVSSFRATIGNDDARNATMYFPRLRMPDPLNENRLGDFAPCGALAGIMARTDAQRGVWKAPAGIEASFSGVQEFTYTLTDGENGRLNPLGLNCLRSFPVAGNLVWGARTLVGADLLASEWKYLPVRRLALYLEESLYRGTQWVVFEPNDEPLWAQIRLNLGAFMQNLFRQGAFQGSSPREAYFGQMRPRDDDPERHQPRHRQHRGRVRAAQTRRVRRHQDPADGRPARGIGERVMAQFTVNAQRFDPYKNFKFRVKWDGRYVAGLSKVGALKRTTDMVEHREGGDPSTSRKSPGRTKFEAITLERGVTHDTEFEKWANKVWDFGSGLGAEVSLKDFRKDIILEVYNEAGQLALAYKVYRCWVSEFQALPDLDANAAAIAIQHIKLENEGWERDTDVTEPTEPSFTQPPV
jgi:phage tail-like protein